MTASYTLSKAYKLTHPDSRHLVQAFVDVGTSSNFPQYLLAEPFFTCIQHLHGYLDVLGPFPYHTLEDIPVNLLKSLRAARLQVVQLQTLQYTSPSTIIRNSQNKPLSRSGDATKLVPEG